MRKVACSSPIRITFFFLIPPWDFMRFSWIFIDFHGFSRIFMDFHGFSWIFMDFHGGNTFWTVLDHFDHDGTHGPMDPWCGALYIRYGGVPHFTHPHGIHGFFHACLD